MKKKALLILCTIALCTSQLSAQTPTVYTTFHSAGIYWKPDNAGGTADTCYVEYKKSSESLWSEGSPLWYDYETHNASFKSRSNEYRGSLVNLTPDTEYDLQLTLQSGATVSSTFTTMSEDFLIKEVINFSGERDTTLNINEGGSAQEGYVLYQADPDLGFTIDVKDACKRCININCSYVIIQGFTLKGASVHGIEIQGVKHVIIEDCDISNWGSCCSSAGGGTNFNSAIYSNNSSSHLIIQRNKLHHPRYDSNSWYEPTYPTHPAGPQGISIISSAEGQNIIRYNEIYSDSEHKFNDGIGGNCNFCYNGFPGHDSDIYGNFINNTWDDAIESEGGGMNVRIFGNYIDTCYMALGLASQSLGPTYVFRNYSNLSTRGPIGTDRDGRGGAFAKIGTETRYADYAKGAIYFYHNTILQPEPLKEATYKANQGGVDDGIVYTSSTKIQKNLISRNNIFNNRSVGTSINDKGDIEKSNDFDYDLYSTSIVAVQGSESHGINATPAYSRFNKAGEYALSFTSKGYDAGVYIPNFNSDYTGDNPDMGAFEYGHPAMIFGTEADWNKQINVELTLPEITFISPKETDLYKASDNVAIQTTCNTEASLVDSVYFYIDNEFYFVDTEAPYSAPNIETPQPGNYNIMALYVLKDGTRMGASTTLHVIISVDSLISSKETLNLAVQQQGYIETKIYPTNATVKTVQWTSEDPSTASIDNNGFVVGRSIGSTRLIVSSDDNNYKDTTLVNVSEAPTDIYQQYSIDPNGLVCIEAEHYHSKTTVNNYYWELVDNDEASNKQAMQSLPNVNEEARITEDYITLSPMMDYLIKFETPGTYYMWTRAKSDNDIDDSYHAGIDGEDVSSLSFYGINAWTDGKWHWSRKVKDGNASFEINDTSLYHSFNAWMRESGLIIDQFLITTNPNYSPIGKQVYENPYIDESPIARGLSLTSSSLVIEQGDSTQLTANVEPAYAITDLRWSSQDASIASVSDNGTIRGVSPGSTVIDIKSSNGELTAQCSVTISEAAGIEIAQIAQQIKLYPNPTKQNINIQSDCASSFKQIAIYNCTGALLQTQTINLQNGNIVSIDLSSLREGIYMLKLTGANTSIVKSFVVEQ